MNEKKDFLYTISPLLLLSVNIITFSFQSSTLSYIYIGSQTTCSTQSISFGVLSTLVEILDQHEEREGA